MAAVPFRIEWKKSTRKDLRKLPAVVEERVVEAVANLAENPFPHGVEKLSGSQHAYRVRLGDYRIVYEVVAELKLIEIQRVRHRKDVYKF
jgi:mRNA interferase RelE/StbE